MSPCQYLRSAERKVRRNLSVLGPCFLSHSQHRHAPGEPGRNARADGSEPQEGMGVSGPNDSVATYQDECCHPLAAHFVLRRLTRVYRVMQSARMRHPCLVQFALSVTLTSLTRAPFARSSTVFASR